MRDCTRTIVSRYNDSPTVWAWEFGNEFSLSAEAPNAADWRPHFNTCFCWPEQRTKADGHSYSSIMHVGWIGGQIRLSFCFTLVRSTEMSASGDNNQRATRR